MALKTPASQLQEMMTRRKKIVHYEVIKDEGPPHDQVFHMQVTADGVTAIGVGRSKQMAKHDAATQALKLLDSSIAEALENAQENETNQQINGCEQQSLPILSNRQVTIGENQTNGVKLLQELYIKYGLPPPQFVDEFSAGPPHHKLFSITCKSFGTLQTTAIARTKKQAKQHASFKMYQLLTSMEVFRSEDEVTCEEIQKNPTRKYLTEKYSEVHLMFHSLSDEDKENFKKHLKIPIDDFLNLLYKEYNISNEYNFYCKNGLQHCALILQTYPQIGAQGSGTNEIDAKQMAEKNIVNYIKLLMN